MKRLLAVVGGWVLSASAATGPDHFAQRFSLALDGEAAYYSITLTPPVYMASQRSDLGDIRVFNAAGEPVPYSLAAARAATRTAPTLQAVRWFPLPQAGTEASTSRAPLGVTIAQDGSLHAAPVTPAREQGDGQLVDIGNITGQVDALLIHLSDARYQGRVSVEASDDLRTWQPVGDAQLLKASYGGHTLEQERVSLEDLHARYLRLRWLDGTPGIASIDVEVQAGESDSTPGTGTLRQWREGLAARAGAVPGEYLFETGGAYPVDRLRFSLPQLNTVVHALVYSRSNAQAPWREVLDATVFRLRNGAGEQSNPPLEIAPDTDREWRIAVDMGNGGLGGGALTVAAGWRPASLTFLARGAGPFTLAVGNAALEGASLNKADLQVGASSVEAAARLSGVIPTAAGGAAPATKDANAPRRYVLWAALLLAVTSLAAMAWCLARRGGQASASE